MPLRLGLRLACRLVILLALLAPTHSALATHPDPLPDWISLGGRTIRFTDDNPYTCMPGTPPPPGADTNFITGGQAQNMIDAVSGQVQIVQPGDPSNFAIGYGALGFLIPETNEFGMRVYDCAPGGPHEDDCDNGSAPADLIKMPSTRYCASSPENILRVIGHEFFHHVQYEYIGFNNWLVWGRASVEGSARMMEDQVYLGLDDGVGTTSFINQVNNYLQTQPGFWWTAHDAALGWKYAAEQFGTDTGEPEGGSDFVQTFWLNALLGGFANVDAPHTFEETIQDFVPSKDLRTWFHDFGIANIARQYDLSNLPDPTVYSYRDENDGNATSFTNVVPAATVLLPGGLSTGTIGVADWTSQYLIASATDCNPGDIMGFRGTDEGPLISTIDTGAKIRFAVLGLSPSPSGGLEVVEAIVRGSGEDFGAAFVLGGTRDYTQISVALTAMGGGRVVDWSFDCGPGAMSISFPSPEYKAYVGPLGPERRTFQTWVRITGPAGISGPTVTGLQKEDFSVYVGTNNVGADEGTVLDLTEAGETYILTVLPPDKGVVATHDLHVNLGPITAAQPQSVSYEEKAVDEMIAIDISGSMSLPGTPGGTTKIVAAQSAASALTDRARSDGKIGGVSFDTNAALIEDLNDVDFAQRVVMKASLAILTPNLLGATSIGDGLHASHLELMADGNPLAERWILLLTDGHENEPLYWTGMEPILTADGVRVVAFGLGKDADHELMARIEKATNGKYIPIDADPEGPGGAAMATLGTGSDPLPNALADAFLQAGELAEQLERLWEAEESLLQGANVSHGILIDEGGVEDATFAFHWADPADVVTIQITRPDLTVVTHNVDGAEIFSGNAHRVFHVGDLDPGLWSIDVTATTGDPDYIGVLAGKDRQATGLKVYFGGTHDDANAEAAGIDYLWGLPQPIIASITDRNGSLPDASVFAKVLHPDGTTLVLPLFDDGLHGDGGPGDGTYANAYTRTTSTNIYGSVGMDGTYRVRVEATGTNSLNEAFTRIRKDAFLVSELNDPPPDTDGDTMPDRYELLHYCLDPAIADEGLDPDADTLPNASEWQSGTDPCHPDTDRGGETDGSEALRGANPFDPDDDALPTPIDPEVVDWVVEHLPFPPGVALVSGTNLIRYPVHSSYTTMHVLRSTSPNGPFTPIASLSGPTLEGLYSDSGLVDGTTYYYQVQPEDLNGSLGAPSVIFFGTPKSEPVPPIGSLIIQNGAIYVDSPNVTLSLVASGDVADMLLSNEPTFLGAAWQPYAALPPWTLVPDPGTGLATVYLRLRDTAGNESPSTYFDSTTVVSPGTLGGVEGQISISGLSDLSGVSIHLVGLPEFAPTFSDALGDFLMGGVPAGTYDVLVQRGGYHDVLVESVVLTGGVTVDLGTIVMTAAPIIPVTGPLGLLLLVVGLGTMSLFGLRRNSRRA